MNTNWIAQLEFLTDNGIDIYTAIEMLDIPEVKIVQITDQPVNNVIHVDFNTAI